MHAPLTSRILFLCVFVTRSLRFVSVGSERNNLIKFISSQLELNYEHRVTVMDWYHTPQMIRPTAAAAHGTFGRHLHMLISVMFYCLLIKPKQFVYHFKLTYQTGRSFFLNDLSFTTHYCSRAKGVESLITRNVSTLSLVRRFLATL